MIEAIRDLGFFELKEVSDKEIFDIQEFERLQKEHPQIIAKLIAEKITAKEVKVYILKVDKDRLIYEPENYKENEYRNYLFKEPRASKGDYISPSFKLSPPSKQNNKPSTSAERLYEYFGSHSKISDLKDFILYNAADFDSILNEIREKNKKGNTSIFVTIKPNGKYLAECPVVASNFINGFLEETRCQTQNAPKTYNPEDQNGQCSVCLRDNLPLLGYLRPYNFFTVDKIGFYPNFKNYESWKYFPVCESCGILIQAGKNFLERYFRTRIAGYNTLVILKNKEIVEKYKRFVDFSHIKSFKQIEGLERHLLKSLPELETVESYNFMFYKEKQNQFEILLLIPDILPSRVKKIVDGVKIVRERFENSNWFDLDRTQKIKGDWRIDTDFYFLEEGVGERVAFPKVTYSPTKVKLLELIHSVFIGYSVSYKDVIAEISAKLQFIFKQSLNFKQEPMYKLVPYVFSGATTIDFLKEVKIMEEEATTSMSGEDYSKKLRDVFEKHSIFFDTPQKRACFLIGVLYGKLEGKQEALEKKGTSLGWLRSLDLRWEYLTKELYPRIHLKFKEYDQIKDKKAVFTQEAKAIFDLASGEFEKCGNEEMTRGEIPFYFTLGWTTYKRFFKEKEEKDE